MADWWPIDTAPKDGTRIVAWCGEERLLYWRKKAWRCPYWGVGPNDAPTHWRYQRPPTSTESHDT